MPQKWWVLAGVACATFMSTLDSSIVNIALPTLTKALDTDLYLIKWVVIVYLLLITTMLLPFGRLSDQYGRKRVFQVGFVIFITGSALCGISASLGWLLASRALQGIGASMLMANSPAIVTASFPAGERGKALGTLAMVVSTGLISGPAIGGFLIAVLGWRSIFLVNIPIGLLGVFLVQRSVTKDMPHARTPFDWAGALLQAAALMTFIALVDPPGISVSGGPAVPVSRLALLIVLFVVGALFIKVESDAKAPLFDMSLLKNRTFTTANIASFLLFVAYSAMTLLMPFFLEEVMHYGPEKAGIFMTAIPLTILVVAPISGRLSDRFGSQELSFVGAMVAALGLFAMAGVLGPGLHASVGPAAIVVGLCAMGMATGLFQSPNNNAIMSVVPPAKLGVASALIATVRNLGYVTGTGLATGLFAWRQRLTQDFVLSLQFTLFMAGIIAIGSMLACLGKRRGPLDHQNSSPESPSSGPGGAS